MVQARFPQANRSAWLSLVIISAFCALFMVLHWSKLDSLWGDPARWLFEAYRSANGEVLYRDFAWQFPPLSLLLMSGAFRLFGSTFEVAQLVLNVLSLIVVLLVWVVARQIMSARLALAVTIASVIAIALGGGPDFRFFFTATIHSGSAHGIDRHIAVGLELDRVCARRGLDHGPLAGVVVGIIDRVVEQAGVCRRQRGSSDRFHSGRRAHGGG